MTGKQRTFLFLITLVLLGPAQSQTPLVPMWAHVDPFGAGSFYPESDQMRTRIAFDLTTDKLYRVIMEGPESGAFIVQPFTPDGVDLTPPEPVSFTVPAATADYHGNQIIRLSAANDELAAIVRHDLLFDDPLDLNWSKIQNVNGDPVWLVGSGAKPMRDMQHDTSGTLVLLDDELRSYSSTGWPNGTAPTDRATGMAILENSVVLGVAPSITNIERATLTAQTPIVVPSNGTAIYGACLANGTSAFNYATRNTNGTIDLGLADIGSGLVWNTTISVPSGTEPTAYHVDEQGNFWIAFSRVVAGPTSQGLLYGFSPSGESSPVGSYGRSIDDITSGGSHLFLTGRQSGSMTSTYVAAFTTEFTIGMPGATPCAMLQPFPNPASHTLSLNSISREVERIDVLDATGRILKTLTGPFGTTINFSVADLAPGSYFVRIDGRAGSTTLPFQVSR